MSYLVIARKWRPRDFSEMIGQEHITKTLTNALRNGRMAHAYLFHGPRGVGKTTAARIVAKAANCERGMGPEPCNVCGSCAAINRGSSLDVVEMDGASNRGIDEIRELKEHVGYAPVSSRYKIYIIDEVHMLTEQAFNALLKTLEEPPPHVIFVFATTEVHKIPATILSRCQRFEFRRIPVALVVDRLASLAEKEHLQAEENALLLMARRADGSLRDAESLLDQAAAATDGTIDERLVRELLGLIPLDALAALLEKMVSGDVDEVVGQLDAMIAEGMELDRIVGDLAELILRAVRGLAHTAVNSSTAQEQERLAPIISQVNTADLLRFLNVLQGAYSLARQSTRPGPLLESAILRCTLMDRSHSIQELLGLMEKATTKEEETSDSDATETRGESPGIEVTEPKPLRQPQTDVGEETLSAALRLLGGSTRSFVSCAEASWRDDGTLHLEYGPGDHFAYQALSKPDRMAELQGALEKATGRRIAVEITARKETAAAGTEKSKEEPPLIRALIDQFDGVVVRTRNHGEEGRNT